MILFRCVGIGNHAIPGGPAIPHRGKAANTHRAGINNRLGHLTRLVDKHACQLERQQLSHILGPVKGQENNLCLDVATFQDMGVGHRPVKFSPDTFGKPVQPGLDSGRAQLRVGISYDSPAAASQAFLVGLLQHGPAHDLDTAGHGFARPDRATDTPEEGLRAHKFF